MASEHLLSVNNRKHSSKLKYMNCVHRATINIKNVEQWTKLSGKDVL